VNPDGAAGVTQHGGDSSAVSRRTAAIQDDVHPHSPLDGLAQGSDELPTDPRQSEGVHLEVHRPRGSRDGEQHARVGLGASV
jgi:hypothetical protein